MTATIKLDWSQLLGFDQAPAPQIADDAASPRMVQLGTRLGSKVGEKLPGFAAGPNSLGRNLRQKA